MNQDTKAVIDLTDAEWTAITDFNGAWERLQEAIERYGERVAREAYAFGHLCGTIATREQVIEIDEDGKVSQPIEGPIRERGKGHP